MMHMHEDVTATVPAKTAMAGGLQASSRFALGDIGNIGAKVSSLSLDPGKKTGAIKKEILSQQPAITRQKTLKPRVTAASTMVFSTSAAPSTAVSLNTISTNVKATALKSEFAIYKVSCCAFNSEISVLEC
jgi:hypothetical protein